MPRFGLTISMIRSMKKYSEAFRSRQDALSYDQVEYGENSAGASLWEIEKELIKKIVMDFRRKMSRLKYLDFACGTGRITCFMRPLVDEATGIDVSPEMLRIADSKSDGIEWICKDITAEQDIVEGKYDVITAFRFMSNAENDLRLAVLRALGERLRDGNSLLLVNTHTNPYSYKMATIAYHTIRECFVAKVHTSYLSKAGLRRLLSEAGFEILSVKGYGYDDQ